MTTLPTRPDGGRDWHKISLAHDGCVNVNGEHWEFGYFIRQIAAHERERCAKWHDEQAETSERLAKKAETSGLNPTEFWDTVYFHRESAAALRKLEP